MSLAIEVNKVTAVLLANGEWINIKSGSFALDSYEFVDGDQVVHGGGQGTVSATGFRCVDVADGEWVAGPLTSIQAVSHME